MKIITGGSGLLGNAFKKILDNAAYPSSTELNLRNQKDVENYLANPNIQSVIHLAAKVGGVKANIDYVSDFYQINTEINNNIISSCISKNIPRLVCCLSTCIYPDEKYVQYPLTEDQLHNGPPHQSNFGYAYSKRMLQLSIDLCNEQYGTEYNYVIPCNIYSEYDSHKDNRMHFMTRLLRRLVIGSDVIMDGSGDVYRQYIYGGDLAKIIKKHIWILFTNHFYKKTIKINISNMI
jgi:GDP-L-fucose synthase